MRRTRQEVALGRVLRIGQGILRREDDTVWHVHQIHRADCTAELARVEVGVVPAGAARVVQRVFVRRQVGFAELRDRWARVTEEPWP